MKNIVSMRWLLARMYEPDVVIADCRFLLGQPEAGRQSYEAGHIPGAVYLDLEKICLLLCLRTEDVIRFLIQLRSQVVSPKLASAPIVVLLLMTIKAG